MDKKDFFLSEMIHLVISMSKLGFTISTVSPFSNDVNSSSHVKSMLTSNTEREEKKVKLTHIMKRRVQI